MKSVLPIYFGCGICMLLSTSATSFVVNQIQNAPAALTTLASSASASASTPSEPMTHIANLLKKQQKAEQLQMEKLLVEDGDPGSYLTSVENENEDDNEAAPTLLQKKIGKILTKLRFISRLTRGGRPGASGGDEDGQKGSEETLSNTTVPVQTENPDTEVEDLDNEISNNTSEKPVSQKPMTFQKIIYPHSSYGEPLKVSFNINERIVNQPEAKETRPDLLEKENVQDAGDPSRLGQIGVFFAEIVGSIVGLLYGAAAHITSGSNAARINE